MANPLLREPLRPEHVKPRLLGHFGTVPGLNLVWAHANRLIRAARSRRRVRRRTGSRRARARTRAPGSRAPTRELYSHIAQDERRDGRVLPPVLVPGRRAEPLRAGDARVRSTKAASSATRCCTRSARCSTIPTSSCSASSATARPKRARWPRAGTSASSSTRRRDGAVLPDPATQRVQDRQPDGAGPDPRGRPRRPCCAATATTRTSSRVTTRPGPPGRWRPRSTTCLDAIARDPPDGPRAAATVERPGAGR